jgi:LmbE family N-acetylglucosaminyl deacetylase
MKRILVLAPHPDDEVVGCAVALRRAIADGASARILFLTTGVPAREVLWPWARVRHPEMVERRREEAVRAAKLLGAEIAGFQDWPTRTLKDQLPAAERLVRAAAHQASEVWAPAWEGAHQDHDVANWIAARLGLPVQEFAEYSFFGGEVHSNAFPDGGGSIALPPEEQAWKRNLLAVYASERGNLRHIRCEREALRPLPQHDYARPPHEGRLFYQRFQWVPFRHPRIDFTEPQDVCRALVKRARDAATPISMAGRRYPALAERASRGRPAPRARPRPNADGGR